MAASVTKAVISDGTNSVEISFQKLEHYYDKQLFVLSVAKKDDTTNTSPVGSIANPLNWNIDLNRLKQVVTVTGYLLEETGSTALTKKNALELILSDSKLCNISWLIGTTTITKYGSILKCKVTEVPYRVGDEHPTTQSKSMIIDLQFSVGQHKG